MKHVRLSFAALVAATVLLGMTGCAVDDEGYGNYDDHYAEVHRHWWAEHHHDEAYERDRAVNEHRAWCGDHDGDESCSGWYH